MGDFVCILKVSRRVEVVFLLFKYLCCDGGERYKYDISKHLHILQLDSNNMIL